MTNHAVDTDNPDFKKIEQLSYESSIIAIQLRKCANDYGSGIPKGHEVMRDVKRAQSILNGLVKENNDRLNYAKEQQ